MNKIKFALTTIIVSIILVLVYFLTFNLAEPKAYDFMTKNFMTQRLPFDNYKKLYGSDDIVLVILSKAQEEIFLSIPPTGI